MSAQQLFIAIAGLFFVLVALLHLVRIMRHVPVQVAGREVPHWISWAGLLVGAAFSVWAFALLR